MKSHNVTSINHIEMYVFNIVMTKYFFVNMLCFDVLEDKKESNGTSTVLLKKNRILILLISSSDPYSLISEEVHKHGDFIKDIAFNVQDIEKIFKRSTDYGFVPIEPIRTLDVQGLSIKVAKIKTFGNTYHTLVEYNDDNHFIIPNLYYTGKYTCNNDGLQDIDHIAIAVQDLNKYCSNYESGLCFYMSHKETVETQKSGMNSVVMNSKNDSIKFVFVEGINGKAMSQISQFLYHNAGEGVQHLAFSSFDILRDISTYKAKGLDFLSAPTGYYSSFSSTLKMYFKKILEDLKTYQILVDRDEKGYLLQIFTRPIQTKPTLFLEIIQRDGSKGFGRNNILALFKSIESQIKQ